MVFLKGTVVGLLLGALPLWFLWRQLPPDLAAAIGALLLMLVTFGAGFAVAYGSELPTDPDDQDWDMALVRFVRSGGVAWIQLWCVMLPSCWIALVAERPFAILLVLLLAHAMVLLVRLCVIRSAGEWFDRWNPWSTAAAVTAYGFGFGLGTVVRAIFGL